MVSGVVSFLGNLTFLGLVIGDILFILAILSYFVKNKQSFVQRSASFVGKNSLSFILLVSAVATSGSLFFSEVGGFEPCKLCWYQRIFMYPITILSLLALLFSDTKIFRYILALALIGLVIAAYHYLMQMFPQSLSCGESLASCSKKQYAQYGFITIPLMSFGAFYLVALLSFFGIRRSS